MSISVKEVVSLENQGHFQGKLLNTWDGPMTLRSIGTVNKDFNKILLCFIVFTQQTIDVMSLGGPWMDGHQHTENMIIYVALNIGAHGDKHFIILFCLGMQFSNSV